jgi:hypothetical protein
MAALSEWLQLMLGEIARKRDDLELARAEEAQRATETHPTESGSSAACHTTTVTLKSDAH